MKPSFLTQKSFFSTKYLEVPKKNPIFAETKEKMITNNLFRECLASIPEDTRAELELICQTVSLR